MLNKLYLSALLAVSGCLSLYSETTESGYTYADGELFSHGTSRTETLDVAMCIDNPALAGFKITSVKAYVNTVDGISSTSLWMSKELKLEKKVNAPDIWSTPVEVKKGIFTDSTGKEREAGVFEYKLEEPYELTGNTVYVGYTMKVDNIDNEALKQPILLSKGADTDGFFFHSNKTVIHWTDYSEKTGGVAVICLTLEHETSDASLGIKTIYPVYTAENEEFSTDIEVFNTGVVPVNSISYSYLPDNGVGLKEGLLELANPIIPDLIKPSKISLKMDGISGLGKHHMPIEIVAVNNMPNTSLAKRRDVEFTVIPFVPKHRPLIEEYTGLWCQYCIRGYIGMEMIRERYADNQVSVCFHNNDDMMVTTDYPVEIPGYPSASIDRSIVLDPYYGTYQDIDFGVRKNLENALSELAIADIDVAVKLDNMNISVESSTRFIKDITDSNYQIGYVLTCDGMSDTTWLQNNGYSGASGLEGTYLEQATKWPKYVDGLVFNDVAIDVTSMMGVPGSLPKDMYMGEPYNHSYSFNIEYNKLVNDIDKLNVVAFIIDKNTGEVINSNKASLGNMNGVDEITSDANAVVSTAYYDIMGRRINNPTGGIFIRVDKHSDGRITSSKIHL